MKSITRWLAPPVFEGDEEMTRQVMLINIIGIMCIAFTLIVMSGALFGGTTPISTLIIDLVACAMILQFLRWLRNGRVALARVGMVISGLVFITGVTASIGTIRTPTAAIFVFWVLMTGLLYDLRGSLIGTVAASLAVLGLILAENGGWLRQPFQGVGVTQWITFTALFGFTSGLTYYITQGTKRALLIAEKELEQRRQVDTALTDSEQRYRTLVEWTPEALVVYRDDKILYVNPAAVKMLGAGSSSDMVGKSIFHSVAPEHRQIILESKAQYEKAGLSRTMLEQKLLRWDGTAIDVEIRSMRIDYDGEPAIQSSMRDITERKAIETALEVARLKTENASQAKSRFLASASHDLRQPAHALGMFVARLAELPHDAQIRHLVDCLDTSVRAMQDMLDGFFDISRLDSEQAQISRVAFPLDGLFGQLRTSLLGAASDKGLRLRVRSSNAWVESDPGLLLRILLNLVSNAVRYTQEGTVLVACRPTHDGSQLRIEVRDSGVGIAAQHHEEIFQEFFQVGNAERDRSKGLGVGLSIVDRACRLLSHPLAMRSAPGRGTCFTLTVPLAPARPGGAYEDATELAAKVEFIGLRVLLIEDDVLGRVGLASLLTSWGCSVTEAEGAKAACDHYRQYQAPDFIISDFRLGGGIDGIEAVDLLSAIAGRRILACLISGDTDGTVKEKAHSAALTLLQKPVRPAKLRSLMRHLVQASVVR